MNAPPKRTKAVPRLMNGDHLTRDEFERRYEAMPEVKKAELIEGVVYMPSPVRLVDHGNPLFLVTTWLGVYSSGTEGTLGGVDSTVRLDEQTEPQPDILLFIDPRCGGQAALDDKGYVSGAPELVVEVAASTVSIDLHVKARAYRLNGVREYIVWRVDDEEIDWFKLRAGKFELSVPESDGLLKSEVFPGLWLDTSALIRSEFPVLLAALNRGLASPEHAAFVQRLQSATTLNSSS